MNISLWDYYQHRASKISTRAIDDLRQVKDWAAWRQQLRGEFFESMGLPVLPTWRTTEFREIDRISGNGFTLQKIAWQILPDCWNAGGIYRPDPLPADKLPAILYVSGHSGNATYYSQRHAIMWTRRGYLCMVFDSIEQGDNPGDHHGLYFHRRPDWISMGYTAAGGELWNSIRALDILTSLPEVDISRIGATGNSGGGAHSFFLSIADERIKAVATSCGVVRPEYMFDRQHLLGHCDCMMYHNLYARDPIEFGALIAPRPLLFCFAMEDYLFSHEQYHRLVEGIRIAYRQYSAEKNCMLFEYHGPHGYQPESVEKINQWFDQHLCCTVHSPSKLAELELSEKTTTVFNGAPPSPNHLAQLPEFLSQTGAIPLPKNLKEWQQTCTQMRQVIQRHLLKNFDQATHLTLKKIGEWLKGTATYQKYIAEYGDNEIWMEMLIPKNSSPYALIGIADTTENARHVLMRLSDIANHTIVVIVPRFCGFNACISQAPLLLRAGAYIGMTPFMLMLEDVLLVLPTLTALPEVHNKQLILYGKGDAGVAALYQTILDEKIHAVILDEIPPSHKNGAYFLNVLKFFDLQHAMGLPAPRTVYCLGTKPSYWTLRLYERLGCPHNLVKAASIREILLHLPGATIPPNAES